MSTRTVPPAWDVAIVGAGPCGLAAGVAMKRAGLQAVIFDRGCVVSGIVGYPTYITFFSTPEKLAIGGMPFVVATEKPTRRDALAYYRAVASEFDLRIRQYETVETAERTGDRITLRTRTRQGEVRVTDARALVVATGYFGHPNRLHVPGEDLPHVSHLFTEGHVGYRQDVVVVGGGNSAVEAALDLHRAGARVTIVHFLSTLDHNIKPWIVPDITNRIKEGSIGARFDSRVRAITPSEVIVTTKNGTDHLPAQQVYLMLGYQPNVELLDQLGVPRDATTGIPAHDRATMETVVPGVFIAGVIASGNDANKTFIENGRFHGDLIARALTRDRSAAEVTAAAGAARH